MLYSTAQHSTAQHSRHLSVQAPAFALQLQPAWSPQDLLLRRSADSCCCLFQRRHMASASACPALSHSQTPDTSESCKHKTDISQTGCATMGCHMTWKFEFHCAMVWYMCRTKVKLLQHRLCETGSSVCRSVNCSPDALLDWVSRANTTCVQS